MAKFGYIPTSQELDSLYNRASSGDAQAVNDLGELNNRLAKRANERMRSMERQGISGTYAYNVAEYYLSEQGRERFSQSRKMDIDDLYENIEQVNIFLRSQTSTGAGERIRREHIWQGLEDAGVFDDMTDEMSPDFQKDFYDFLDTDAWEDIRKHNKGGTNDLIKQAADAINNGAKKGDLVRAFKDFQKGKLDTDYIGLWDNWTSGKMYYKGGSWHELKTPRF